MAERSIPDISDLEEKYPSNSYASRDKKAKEADIPDKEEGPHKKRVKTVAKGSARKQSLVSKLGKAIIEDSVESVKERVFNEIIVPGIKSLIFDTVTDVADAVLFGGTGDPRGYQSRRNGRRVDHTSYDGYFGKQNRRPRNSSKNDDRRDYSDYCPSPDEIFDLTKAEANKALNEVQKCIRRYGEASIADFYDAVGFTADWSDDQYGWTSIRGARVKRIGHDNYCIIMPPTEELD